jgi:hypothetical protein
VGPVGPETLAKARGAADSASQAPRIRARVLVADPGPYAARRWPLDPDLEHPRWDCWDRQRLDGRRDAADHRLGKVPPQTFARTCREILGRHRMATAKLVLDAERLARVSP